MFENEKVTTVGSVAPLIGAEDPGVGVAESGMWPSPANSPDVASSPIQPAPGTYTSAQACRSVKSALGPEGPPPVGAWSATSWTR